MTTSHNDESDSRSFRIGVVCALLAHVCWGFFPLYWRMVGSVSSFSLTAHRVVWSFLILATLCTIVPRLRRSFWKWHGRRTLAIYATAAVMIGINWLAFLYAVGTDRVLQASLGYYINPLVNVLLGVVILHERLRVPQRVAVVLAAIGVGVMAVAGEGVPWIALTMALSFGLYGLLKKKATLGPFEGLAMETGILFPFAATYLCLAPPSVDGQPLSTATWILLVCGGAITITPLALFAVAAKRVPLSTIGILQYIGPTLQWIVGAIVLGEPVSTTKFIGFAFVWAGVLVFIAGDHVLNRIRRPTANHETQLEYDR
ncbi:EamA-like transporter family protein [Rubripirellula lacrimiformis]|uniref:EamA-like transporter family protein n=1 Tax=Rubripirellula lacrimiformis TaxID=1930273 RepID=A0A517NLM2_9BACT|nr:EamA family transporter RarD [Rubripirellula lacrimiformis]QDT08037.1 EamA-like transporter family protein [Rubripirellula lacrimiformis]